MPRFRRKSYAETILSEPGLVAYYPLSNTISEPVVQLKVKYRLIKDGEVAHDQHMMFMPRRRYQTDHDAALESLTRRFGDAGYVMDSVEVNTDNE